MKIKIREITRCGYTGKIDYDIKFVEASEEEKVKLFRLFERGEIINLEIKGME